MPKVNPKKARPQRNRQPPARLRQLSSDSEDDTIIPHTSHNTAEDDPTPNTQPSSELAEISKSIRDMCNQQQQMLQQQHQLFLSTLNSLQSAVKTLSPPAQSSSVQSPSASASTLVPSATSTSPIPSTSTAVMPNDPGLLASTTAPQGDQLGTSLNTPLDGQPGPSNAPGELPILLPFNPPATTAPCPVRMAGTPIGAHVPHSIKIKIWEEKYVDLVDILYPTDVPAYALSIDPHSGSPQLSLQPKRKRQLSETEWAAAMDVFVAIYLERYPSKSTEILTYVKSVKELMQDRADWAYYDFHYRSDRALTREPWTTANPALEAKARYRGFKPRPQPNKANQSFRGHSNFDNKSHIPFGFCFAYHSQGRRCTAMPCNYSHVCYNCTRNHPAFQKCHNPPKRETRKPDSRRDPESRDQPPNKPRNNDRKSDQR